MLRSLSMLDDPHFRRRLSQATSMTAATVGLDRRPTTCRAVGLDVDGPHRRVSVYLPLSTASRSIANLVANGRLALVCSNPTNHDTVQIKGDVVEARIASETDRSYVNAWQEGFVEGLSTVGMPRALTRSIRTWPAFCVVVDVTEIYEQTPGPRAGARVEGR